MGPSHVGPSPPTMAPHQWQVRSHFAWSSAGTGQVSQLLQKYALVREEQTFGHPDTVRVAPFYMADHYPERTRPQVQGFCVQKGVTMLQRTGKGIQRVPLLRACRSIVKLF